MPPLCDYCSGPLIHEHRGRPRPTHTAASYCCHGCLSLGEQDRTDESGGRRSFAVGVRLAVGVLVIAQSMIFGLAVSLEEETSPGVKLAVQGSILAGTVLVLNLLGGPLIRSAFGELRQGRITLEAMFLLTLGGAMAASLQSMIVGDGPIYFEVVSVLLVVYTLGREMTARTRSLAVESSRRWLNETAHSRRIVGDGEEEVPTGEIQIGDVLSIRPGEAIPLDGVIHHGEGLISEAAVNGEPLPMRKGPGDPVHAGAVSHDARFVVTATSELGSRRIDALSIVLENARLRPTPSQNLADRLGRVLFPLTLFVAVGTFLFWTHQVNWRMGLVHAMSVLLVACPCAVGLATPLVIWSTLSRLAERGLVLNSGEAVEKLARIDLALFDKTGTLSEDELTVKRIDWLKAGVDRDAMLNLLTGIEEQSNHPVARAFRDSPSYSPGFSRGTASPRLKPGLYELRVNGVGMEGKLSLDGVDTRFRVGHLDWLDTVTQNHRRVGFELDGEPILVAELEEEFRPSVATALDDFRSLNIGVGMLTGDPVPRPVGDQFDFRCEGMLPDEKAEFIRERQAEGSSLLMVGDGVNDAAALAQADVGIALASGTDLANGVADGSLYHGDLAVLPWAVAMSREAVRRVRRGLIRSMAYNVVGVSLAAGGVLHPVVAALLMVVSSLSVMWSSVRVGVEPGCRAEGSTAAGRVAVAHGLFFSLQGWLVAELLGVSPLVPLILFTVGGILIGFVWNRWSRQPHWFDMLVGMLTVGNFGMLLGWFADGGFKPLSSVECCCCSESKSGMWLGMLIGCNLAMFFPRSKGHAGHSRLAMLTGGNFGMIFGMVLGGRLGTAFWPHFLGMTAGMVLGMILLSELTQRLLAARIPIRRLLQSGDRDAERVDAPLP